MPDLKRANGLVVAAWLAEHAALAGKPCGRSTEDAWRKRWTAWIKFCERTGNPKFPIELPVIQGYVVESAVLGQSRDSVLRGMRFLKSVASAAGAAEPLESPAAKACLERLVALHFPRHARSTASQPPPVVEVEPPPKPKARTGRKRKRRAKPATTTFRLDDDSYDFGRQSRAETSAEADENDDLGLSGSESEPEFAQEAPSPGERSECWYELPDTYGWGWWTYGMRQREQGLAAWAGRRAVRTRSPMLNKLVEFAVNELKNGYTEIGAAVFLGCISGAGGFRKVAAAIGTTRAELARAFERDEVPPPEIIRALLVFLYMRDWEPPKQDKRSPPEAA